MVNNLTMYWMLKSERIRKSILRFFTKQTNPIYEFVVSKETVVLRRWERSKQKFGFIKRVDKS